MDNKGTLKKKNLSEVLIMPHEPLKKLKLVVIITANNDTKDSITASFLLNNNIIQANSPANTA
ncbi:hypothetical protein, partial [Nonlabens ulvanivorans]|uniref:hypothetical protein n=1 Tax=Nonlabens ulvanivorans TaxID=906888 RepID=UPI00329A59A9